MDFAYPQEIAEFRKEFGRYLDSVVTEELLREITTSGAETTGPLTKAFWRRLGEDGYFGLGWPIDYGGGGKSVLYLHAFNYVMMYRRLPVPIVTLNTVAPALMRVGSDAQKQAYLPRILRGEIEFAIGYSEPGAGTDLASLETKAVRDGDTYVVKGQKVFTSGAHHSDFVWLAVRTDPEAPKHRGISLLIVPLDSEGVEVRPFPTMGGYRTNITFYDNVRVPISSLVGEENRGWTYITTQLDFERVAISPIPGIERVFDSLCTLFRDDGRMMGEWTRAAFARWAADINALKVMDLKMASMIDNGEVPYYEASLLKVLSTEFQTRFYNEALQALGNSGLVKRGSPGEILNGDIERSLKSSTVLLFGGGSNDVQRDIIATHGLGLAR
ncbi:MAG TPA: acyl-CoA dehydrogenase family protein [Dehalococcoidia bacterium]|nr:acyl-CoA dehydrogenase family protein [Dehalococcoidia bacterium]